MNHTRDSLHASDPIQQLEPRRLLASTLTVRGTDNADFIEVDVRLASDGTKFLRAIINDTRRNFDLTGVSQIRIESIGGDDTVIVDDHTVRGIYVNGGLGNDSLTGGSGPDTLTGGRGRDLLSGRDGGDRINGNDDNDTMEGGDGADRLYGGNANDFVTGGEGADRLQGDAGIDQMFGEDGNDSFFSRDGELDTVSGGNGDNTAQSDLNDALSDVDRDLP
jgi:Ca2+-binding RTX toxin-like protein